MLYKCIVSEAFLSIEYNLFMSTLHISFYFGYCPKIRYLILTTIPRSSAAVGCAVATFDFTILNPA